MHHEKNIILEKLMKLWENAWLSENCNLGHFAL